jgi:hypothetical protein
VKRILRPVAKTVRRLEYAASIPERALMRRGIMSTDDLMLPQFLGLGAAKTGSTWIHHCLDAHPEVFVPPGKELHYFCHFYHHTVHWYARQFTEAGDRVRGEITPNYAELKADRIDVVADLLPEARLLLMLRHPVDRAWSHAQMNLARQLKRPVESVPTPEYIAHARSAHSLDSGDYVGIVDRWTRRYPLDQLWIGTFDQMVTDPRSLLTALFGFLGVSTEVDWSTFPLDTVIDRGAGVGVSDLIGQRGGEAPMPPEVAEALTELYAPRMDQMKQRFGGLVERWT